MGQPGMGQPGMPPGMGQPGMPPGQPGQPGMGQQDQTQGPKMGFDFGGGGLMPRINYEGGDFSVGALQAAVLNGQGFGKPRLMGAALLGLAIVFFGANVALVRIANRYYPYLYSLSAIFLMGGFWLLVTGQPVRQPDGSQAPLWGRIGLGAFMAVGLLLGIAMIFVEFEFLLF